MKCTSMPSPREVDRAIKYSYGQAALGAVFAASTGGMFLTGFALKLGADDMMLGLIMSFPMFFIVFQFAGAHLVEKGISRKKLAFWFGIVTPLCWALIATIPFVGTERARHLLPSLAAISPETLRTIQFWILMSILALVMATSQFSNAARGSWVGELIPEEKRGKFFGKTVMFWMIIASIFAIAEGRFIDYINSMSLFAFTILFFFGALFGLAGVFLNLPQPDCPLPREESKPTFGEIARRTMRNRPFVSLAIVHGCWSLTNISGPFFPAYQIRDIGLTFLQVGVLNSVWMVGFIIGAPIWGRLTKHYGCKPIIQLGFLSWAPCTLIWFAIPPGDPVRACWLLPIPNFISGIAASALNVGVNTMVYKTSQPVGRSTQFAMYNTFVTLVGAPMAILGGWAVSHLQAAGYHVDLRLTFIAGMCFVLLAAFATRRLTEEGATGTRSVARSVALYHLPNCAVSILGLDLATVPVYSTLLRKLNVSTNPGALPTPSGGEGGAH